MRFLLITSFLWAFSFGVIKTQLPGVDASFVSFARMLLSFLVFLPFLLAGTALPPRHQDTKSMRTEKPSRNIPKLIQVRGVQFGMMHLLYLHAFKYLKAYQVAFFTVFTPLFVTLFNDLLERRFRSLFLVSAALAVLGTGIITYREFGLSDLRMGFWLMQGSNLCFAAGQILYKRGWGGGAGRDRDVFGWLYLGAVLVTLPIAGNALSWRMPSLTAPQGAAILYLGVVASGLGFFLWNVGAKRVNAGALAVMNNLKVPLAAWVSILVFRESADLLRVALGTLVVVAALLMNESGAGSGGFGNARPDNGAVPRS